MASTMNDPSTPVIGRNFPVFDQSLKPLEVPENGIFYLDSFGAISQCYHPSTEYSPLFSNHPHSCSASQQQYVSSITATDYDLYEGSAHLDWFDYSACAQDMPMYFSPKTTSTPSDTAAISRSPLAICTFQSPITTSPLERSLGGSPMGQWNYLQQDEPSIFVASESSSLCSQSAH